MTQLASSPQSSRLKTTDKPLLDTQRSDQSVSIVLDVENMMCAGCVSTVEKKIAQCEGVASATVNLVTEVAAVTCLSQTDPQQIAKALTQALTAAGYPSQVRTTGADATDPMAAETDWLARQQASQQNQSIQLTISITLLILSTIGHLEHVGWAQGFSIPILSTLWFHGMLATLTLIFPARNILIEGLKSARRGTPNMNTLVSLGAISAYTTSLVALFFPSLGWECFFDEPVMLLSFILLGRTLEQRARFQAAGSLRSLIALQPTLARLVSKPNAGSAIPNADTNEGVQIPANQVHLGEWLRVLPSEKVPADGIIILGETTLDESMLTGESMPVAKQPGDEVVAGSLNQSGAITLQVSRIGIETTLAKMIRLVETAQSRKAPIQSLADSISGYFTYGILTCALLTFIFWHFIGVPLWPEIAASTLGHLHHGMGSANSLRWLVSLKLAIAVIVVACPCALGLATPTAILVGSGIGARKGLLIRGGDVLEATCHLDTLVFDKTGTLTTGRPQLTDCVSLTPTFSNEQLLRIAATVESGTRHPLGIAIQQAAEERHLTLLPARGFQTQAGCGITAELKDIDGAEHTPFYMGNRAWLNQNGCAVSDDAQTLANQWGKEGKTAVFIAQKTNSAAELIGVVSVADTLRKDAASTLKTLRSLGFNLQILSGDSIAAATAIAQQLGLSADQVQAEVTPAEKVSAIADLQRSDSRVGFIGDGINDAPALAQANVGIALGSGTEVAMETADIVLMSEDLTEVLTAIQLSRATFNKIKQNLTWAFTYNLICIPLAAGAFLPTLGLSLNPGLAGGLMALSSITVVLNALLLKTRF